MLCFSGLYCKPLKESRKTNHKTVDNAEVTLQFMIWEAVNSDVLINIYILIKHSDLKLPFGIETQKSSYFRIYAKTTKNNKNQTTFLIPQESGRLLESKVYNKLQNCLFKIV